MVHSAPVICLVNRFCSVNSKSLSIGKAVRARSEGFGNMLVNRFWEVKECRLLFRKLCGQVEDDKEERYQGTCSRNVPQGISKRNVFKNDSYQIPYLFIFKRELCVPAARRQTCATRTTCSLVWGMTFGATQTKTTALAPIAALTNASHSTALLGRRRAFRAPPPR